MRQVSLVAFYGPKSEPLAGLIQQISARAEHTFGSGFESYHGDDIHATVVGMERAADPKDAEPIVDDRPGRTKRLYLRSGQDLAIESATEDDKEEIRTMVGLDRSDEKEWSNANLLARSGRHIRMRFRSIPDVLRSHLPMRVRFGGYAPTYAPFLSCGQPPYLRSLYVHRSSGRLVLIGWPGGNELSDLRIAVEQRCGIAHKYEGDNDCYIVLGHVSLSSGISETLLSEFELAAREWLRYQPTQVSIREPVLGFASYTDKTMPTTSTEFLGLDIDGFSEKSIMALYEPLRGSVAAG